MCICYQLSPVRDLNELNFLPFGFVGLLSEAIKESAGDKQEDKQNTTGIGKPSMEALVVRYALHTSR
jgi:hypothetical protein